MIGTGQWANCLEKGGWSKYTFRGTFTCSCQNKIPDIIFTERYLLIFPDIKMLIKSVFLISSINFCLLIGVTATGWLNEAKQSAQTLSQNVNGIVNNLMGAQDLQV